MISTLLLLDTQEIMSDSKFALIMLAIYVPIFAVMAFLGWLAFGKHIRCWWRRRKLKIPSEENGVKTISGPTWEITWVKTSEAKENRPDEVRSVVMGNTLPEVFAVLRARYGDEFDEQNVRSTSKQSYSNILVGLPER